MKAPTINKKWILTASLLSVLVSQYSYQTSSLTLSKTQTPKNYGEYVLASTEDRLPAQAATPTTRPARGPVKRTDAKPAPTAPETKPTDNAETESAATEEGACTSGDCKTAATDISNISAEDFTKLITRLEALEKAQKETSTTTEAPAKTEDKELTEVQEECGVAKSDESRSDKRDRLKCEKDFKEKEARDERIAKFEDRADALKDKCDEDLECLTSGFTSLLSRYEGKSAIPLATVNKQFRLVMGTALSKALYSSDPEALETTLAAIQSLMQDMPDQYRALKQTVITGVKNQAQLSANKVSASYAKANDMAKQNNPQAYFEALKTAQSEHQVLTYLSNSYSSSIEQSLQTAQDLTTFAYYQKSYIPDMQKIMAAVMGGPATSTSTTTTTTGTGDTRINTSGTSQPSVTTTIPSVNGMDDGKMTRDPRWFPAVTQSSNIQFGPASTTPTLPQNRPGRTPQ